MKIRHTRYMFLHCRSMLISVVGLLASSAIGFPLNPTFTPEAVKEYKVKADAGDAEAQYLYATALVDGHGVVKDLPQAFVYAKKVVGQGDERALGLVGRGYERGWGVESNSVKAAECYSRFVTWATKAAEDGDVDAQLSLGKCYYAGKGVKTNMLEVVKWFRKVAEQGYVIAQYCLGSCYDAGIGVETNKIEAVKWYRRAAEQGCPIAQVDLGLKYVNEAGVGQDLMEAVKWFRKAAEQEDATAQCLLGITYENGKGVETNKAEAVKWYSKAAEQGFGGSELAQNQLGRCYEYGEGVEMNKAEAVKWYRKAAEQGNASAQNNLGFCYNNGEGVETNKAEAVKWYRKAAEQGNASAQYNLGFCYKYGDGVETNKAEAVKWYRKAAEQGHANAQCNLGFCYKYGEGVETNKAEAVKWYRKAAEQGHDHGIFQIVRMDPNPAKRARISWKLSLSDEIKMGANRIRSKLALIREPEDDVTGRIASVKPLSDGFLVTADDISGEGRIGLSYNGAQPIFYDVNVCPIWLVPVASCRSAVPGKYDAAVFIPGMEKGLAEGAVISPSKGKCGYRVISISDRCVWFEALYGDEPPEGKLPRGPWPDFSRIDTISPTPPPGCLMLGKRHFWPGDAIKLPKSASYLMVDSFLDGKGVVFRLLDSTMRPNRELLCVIVREK